MDGWMDKWTNEMSNGVVSLSLVRFRNVAAIYSRPFRCFVLFPHTVSALSRSLLEFHCSSLSPFALQRAANMIPAHDSPLAALAFDASGTKLATASEKVNGDVTFFFFFSFRSAFALIRMRLCRSLAGNSHPRLLHPGGPEAL